MRALEIITGHVIYNPAYTYKFQLKTTIVVVQVQLPANSYSNMAVLKQTQKTTQSNSSVTELFC